MTKGQQVGYIRVSSADQNPERQLLGIELDKTFTDFASGRDTNRPQFQQMLGYVREGDTLYVHEMCRLARNHLDLGSTIKVLNEKGITVKFVTENLTFTGDDSPITQLLLALMGGISQFTLAQIHERQMEGIALAKKKGKFKGRKPVPKERLQEAREYIFANPGYGGVQEASKKFNIARSILYKYLPDLKDRYQARGA